MNVTDGDRLEVARVREACARRAERGVDARYVCFDPANLYLFQRRERALLETLRRHRLVPLAERRVLDFGCGDGAVLRDLVRYGASPRCLEGVDLRRVSLAPPITRALAGWSWLACELLEKLPFLSTHYLAAIVKRSD